MSLLARRIGLAGLGAAIALGLTLAAVATYHALPATGLRLDSGQAIGRSARALAQSTNATCLALPHAIRLQAPPVAYTDHGKLGLVDLATCRERTLLASGAVGPVRASADGRWVGSGPALATATSGGETLRPLGAAVWSEPDRLTWAWAPRGERIAGITTRGAVLIGQPGQAPRMLEPDNWGATSLAFDGDGALAVVRGSGELWLVPTDGAPARFVYSVKEPVIVPVPANVTRARFALPLDLPDPSAVLQLAAVDAGSAVLWRQPFVSASTAADGDQLIRIDLRTGIASQLAGSVLLAPGYVTACGPGLAVLVGAGRDATAGKRIVVFDREWRGRTVGTGVSPSCSADGRTIAYAVGSGEPSLRFGVERRNIEVVFGDGRTRTIVGPSTHDSGADQPMLSADGSVVEWIQTESDRNGVDGPEIRGALRAALTLGSPHLTGPIADLGAATDYYGTLSWPQTVTSIASP